MCPNLYIVVMSVRYRCVVGWILWGEWWRVDGLMRGRGRVDVRFSVSCLCLLVEVMLIG